MSAARHADPFGRERLRRGLAQFAIGRLVSALLTFALLLVVVRSLPARDYGMYVVLQALLEIIILLGTAPSNVVAQRYVSEALLPANAGGLSRLVWGGLLVSLSLLVVIAGLMSSLADVVMRQIGVSLESWVFQAFMLAIVADGLCRYVISVFESLFEQGWSRLATIFKAAGKLVGVSVVIVVAGGLDLGGLVAAEAMALVAVAGLSTAMLCRVLGQIVPPAVEAGPNRFRLSRIGPFVFQMTVAQFVSQLYGPHAVRLLVSRLLGAAQAALFGFAHSLVFFLQQYLPSQLLAGLIRPVLVAHHAGGGDRAALNEAGNLVLKVNHFIIVPVIVFFGVSGEVFAAWLSAGKYGEAGVLLFGLSGLLVIQSLHFVLSMLTVALEHRFAFWWGTLSAVPGVVVGVLLARLFGVGGLVAGLWVSELLWCLVAWLALRRGGFTFRIDIPGWLKIAACGGVAALPALAATGPMQASPFWQLSASALLVGVGYLVASALLKPFTAGERARINGLLPRPWFVF